MYLYEVMPDFMNNQKKIWRESWNTLNPPTGTEVPQIFLTYTLNRCIQKTTQNYNVLMNYVPVQEDLLANDWQKEATPEPETE